MKQIKNRIGMTAAERETFFAQVEGITGRPAEQTVFMDIETTGFSRMYDSVYLIGLLYEEKGEVVLEQFLAEGTEEEPSLLHRAGERLKKFVCCLTYNGEAFDLPFLKTRAEKLYVTGFGVPETSFDLLKRYRPYSRWFGWPDMKLKSLERFLGIEREDIFHGGQLIEVFHEYARTGDERLEKVLLLHNYEDIQNMPALLRIEEFWQAGHTCRVREAHLEGEVLRFCLDRRIPLSVEIEGREKSWRFQAGSEECFLRCPITEEALRYYLPSYKDYYYLPETREIVHKSLAGSIPGSKRRAATRNVCWLPGNGRFWPGRDGDCPGLRCFRREAKDKSVYYAIEELSAWIEVQEEEGLTQWFRKLWQ